jgi:hypothetical protein
MKQIVAIIVISFVTAAVLVWSLSVMFRSPQEHHHQGSAVTEVRPSSH